MSKHTPTPWVWTQAEGFCDCGATLGDDDRHTRKEDCDGWVYEQAANLPDVFDVDMDEYHGLSDVNAARIVACVNAFHSEDGREISTERIEPGLVWALWDAAKDFHEAMSLNPSITAAMYGPDFDLDKRRKNCAEALAALLDKMEG